MANNEKLDQPIVIAEGTVDNRQEREMSRRDIRALAFHFVYAMEQFDYSISLEAIVDNFRQGYGVEVSADSFAIMLARGTIANRDRYDQIISPHLKNWRLERLGCCTKLILRMALWEIEQPDAITSVIINEAVELAKGFAEKDAYKFVNGVLDEVIKERDEQKKHRGATQKD